MCQRKEEHSMCVMMPSLLQDGIMKGIPIYCQIKYPLPIYCQIKYPLDQAEEFGENAKKGMNGWQAQITGKGSGCPYCSHLQSGLTLPFVIAPVHDMAFVSGFSIGNSPFMGSFIRIFPKKRGAMNPKAGSGSWWISRPGCC